MHGGEDYLIRLLCLAQKEESLECVLWINDYMSEK